MACFRIRKGRPDRSCCQRDGLKGGAPVSKSDGLVIQEPGLARATCFWACHLHECDGLACARLDTDQAGIALRHWRTHGDRFSRAGVDQTVWRPAPRQDGISSAAAHHRLVRDAAYLVRDFRSPQTRCVAETAEPANDQDIRERDGSQEFRPGAIRWGADGPCRHDQSSFAPPTDLLAKHCILAAGSTGPGRDDAGRRSRRRKVVPNGSGQRGMPVTSRIGNALSSGIRADVTPLVRAPHRAAFKYRQKMEIFRLIAFECGQFGTRSRDPHA